MHYFKLATLLGANKKSSIIRTERGLAIAGTRITLYDVMDYVKAQYPSKFIQGLFDLTIVSPVQTDITVRAYLQRM